eukprot:TRINITY_DN67772_c0_g1_i2.p1 TRINITY_DN67772_c0_g1~~TRINITY_DN67772_c0_g1_i2.p1  ORF type:complete len:123 (+),score=3.25 TRINITY_DN67772_c0_g1_i2:81-449(+)
MSPTVGCKNSLFSKGCMVHGKQKQTFNTLSNKQDLLTSNDVDNDDTLAWILGWVAGMALLCATCGILFLVWRRPPATPSDMPMFGDEPEHQHIVVPTEYETDPYLPPGASQVMSYEKPPKFQ